MQSTETILANEVNSALTTTNKNSKTKEDESRWLEATKENDTSILKFERPIRFYHFLS